MPRRKQYCPKKHDTGTNSTMTAETALDTDQQQDAATTSDKPSPSHDRSRFQSDETNADGKRNEFVLDLSIRKRPRRSDSEDVKDNSPVKTQCPLPPTSNRSDAKVSNFSSNVSPVPLSKFTTETILGASSALASTPHSTTPFVPIYVPPFRFPPFASNRPGLTSSPPSSSNQSMEINGDSLSKLSTFVHQVGKGNGPNSNTATTTSSTSPNDQTALSSQASGSLQEALGAAAGHGLSFQELWLRFVKKEENAELKRLNEAKQIFTCLQCHASFQTMEQLVKHMETTQHYANIPKHYSWSLQYARQRMRQMKMKMKYSDKMMYYCFLCTAPFTEPVHIHFNCVHNMHNPVENMKFVHVISVNGRNAGRTAASSACSSSGQPSRVGRSTSPAANGESRKRFRSNEEDVRLSSSPLSVDDGSSCESGSVSPSPSSSSRRSATIFSPPASENPIDCRILVNNPGAYTDNLLLKMEKLVQTAAGDKCQTKGPVDC